ncbi:MAG TPA: response regulator [Sedimenticola sp.]|nr:response regulator [Sedimenticola sp.]
MALIRLGLLLVAGAVILLGGEPGHPGAGGICVAATIAIALLLLWAAVRGRMASRPWQLAAATFDPLAISALLLIGDQAASPLWLAYPLTMLTHARLFGHRSMVVASALSATGFGLVLATDGYWQQNTGLGLALLAGVILFPLLALRGETTPAAGAPTAKAKTSPVPASRVSPATTGRAAPHRLDGRRVLLLSRDYQGRQEIERHLDSWGAETRICTNSARAFAALLEGEQQHTPFLAVIVDQGQFDMDSRQFAISIRSEPALEALHLIHIGMPALDSLVEQFYSIGYNQLLRKPLDKTLLFAALHGVASSPTEEEPQVVHLLNRYAERGGRTQPLHILLAESDPAAQQRTRTLLQRAGHQVFAVQDGAQALNAIDSRHFDLAVVSYQLREVNGLEAFKLHRFTRLDEEWVPFLLLLDEQSTSQFQACQDAGVDAVLVPPFSSRQLLDQLERIGNRHHAVHPHPPVPRQVSSFLGGSHAVVIDGLTLDGQRLQELEQLGRGRDFLAELLQNFDRECSHFTTQLEEAILSENNRRLRDLGHVIKDSAGSLGMLDLYHIGLRLSRTPLNQSPERIDSLLEELKTCCRDSHKALQHYLSQRPSFRES